MGGGQKERSRRAEIEAKKKIAKCKAKKKEASKKYSYVSHQKPLFISFYLFDTLVGTYIHTLYTSR